MPSPAGRGGEVHPFGDIRRRHVAVFLEHLEYAQVRAIKLNVHGSPINNENMRRIFHIKGF